MYLTLPPPKLVNTIAKNIPPPPVKIDIIQNHILSLTNVVQALWETFFLTIHKHHIKLNTRRTVRTQVTWIDCGVEIKYISLTDHHQRLHGNEPEINLVRLPVRQHEHLLQFYEIRFPGTSASANIPSSDALDFLAPEAASGITSIECSCMIVSRY